MESEGKSLQLQKVGGYGRPEEIQKKARVGIGRLKRVFSPKNADFTD